MLIRIGRSWIYNTDCIKCIGIYKDENIIHVERTDGKEDQIQMNSPKEAIVVLEEIMNAVALPPLNQSIISNMGNNTIIPKEDNDEGDFDDAK